MIYTVTLPGHIYARPGKSVWRTREEAQEVAEFPHNTSRGMRIGLIDADWERHTRPDGKGNTHELLIEAIIAIEQESRFNAIHPG